jgi:septum site-determining protein MinC
MPIRPISEEDVLIKGSSSGILIVLNLYMDYEKLLKKLVQKLKKDRKFLSETRLTIKGIDRNLDIDELGMARKIIRDKTGLELFAPDSSVLDDKLEKTSIDTFGKVEFFENTLRAGDNVVSTNSVVIFGDINPGASILSSGSIYVYGKIRGTVQAGTSGNRSSIVTCLGLSPILLSIDNCFLSSDLDLTTFQNCICCVKIDDSGLKVFSYKKE